MKNRLLSLVQRAIAPVALVTAMAAFSPITVMAQNRGGHEGGRGGEQSRGSERSNAAPRNFNAGRSFSDHGNERGNFNRGDQFSERGRGFSGDFNRGREFRGDFRGGRGYGPGFGFGVGVYPSYGYAAPVCNPAGFYDRFGVWHFYPGCAAPPYGY
jgi:hypothetical protein